VLLVTATVRLNLGPREIEPECGKRSEDSARSHLQLTRTPGEDILVICEIGHTLGINTFIAQAVRGQKNDRKHKHRLRPLS